MPQEDIDSMITDEHTDEVDVYLRKLYSREAIDVVAQIRGGMREVTKAIAEEYAAERRSQRGVSVHL